MLHFTRWKQIAIVLSVLLGTQEQQIEDDEHQQDRHQLYEEVAAASGGLRIGRGDEHQRFLNVRPEGAARAI